MTRISDLATNTALFGPGDVIEGERANGDSEQWTPQQLGLGWVDLSSLTPTMVSGFSLVTWQCYSNGFMLLMFLRYEDDAGRASSETGDIGNTTVAVVHPDILAMVDLPSGLIQSLSSGWSGRVSAHSVEINGDISRNAITSTGAVAAGANMSATGLVLWNVSGGALP